MPVHWTQCDPKDQMFTFIADSGEPFHFNTSLDKACRELNVPIVEIQLTPAMVEHVRTHNGVEEDHVVRLTPTERDQPILLCLFNTTQCVVDGNHRFVRRFRDGFNTIQAHAIPESLWRQYLITGITPEVSQFFVDETIKGQSS